MTGFTLRIELLGFRLSLAYLRRGRLYLPP
jgi:hypothetical protein